MIGVRACNRLHLELQARLFYHNQLGTDSYLSMVAASRYAAQGDVHSEWHSGVPWGPNSAEASQPMVLRKFCSEIQDMVLCLTRMLGWSYGQHQ